MAFMLVWMRLSTQKQLPWYKGSNYQSTDVAHIQKTLAQRMGDKANPHPCASRPLSPSHAQGLEIPAADYQSIAKEFRS